MIFEYYFTSVGFPLITHNQEKNIKEIQTEGQSTQVQSLNPQNCPDHQKQRKPKICHCSMWAPWLWQTAHCGIRSWGNHGWRRCFSDSYHRCKLSSHLKVFYGDNVTKSDRRSRRPPTRQHFPPVTDGLTHLPTHAGTAPKPLQMPRSLKLVCPDPLPSQSGLRALHSQAFPCLRHTDPYTGTHTQIRTQTCTDTHRHTHRNT